MIHTIPNRSDLRPYFSRLRPLGLSSLVACVVMALATAAVAQKPAAEPTLVPGSDVNLEAITGLDWVQGEGPATFEPDKVYVFECWATWCGPCVALIPHVNDLHKKYYDKGLRVHGMNSWEEGRQKTVDFVKKKGDGMSYPVAYTSGSAFETDWLEAAGVESIPHAFVVRNGKLLLATEAVRLTDSLIELMLSGDEGAAKAAAIIEAAHAARGETEALSSEIYRAKIKKNAELMAAKITELETIDPGHYDLAKFKLELLIVQEDWPAAITTLNEMPPSNSKTTFISGFAGPTARGNADAYPASMIKAFLPFYEEYITAGGKNIGPNHLAYLTILHWRNGDKENAIISADKGLEAAINHERGASEIRTNAFKRFAKSVREGTLPEFAELQAWQIKARDAEKKAEKK